MWKDNETPRPFKWKYRVDSDKSSEGDVEKTLDFEGLPSGSEENIHVRWCKNDLTNNVNVFY